MIKNYRGISSEHGGQGRTVIDCAKRISEPMHVKSILELRMEEVMWTGFLLLGR